MKHDEAIKTIREALERFGSVDLTSSVIPHTFGADVLKARGALLALDQLAAEPSDDAPDFDHYWQIVINWAQDMGTIKKLSIHEMRMLCERLQSITAHSIAGRNERIRRECVDRAIGYCKHLFPWGSMGSYADSLRDAIMDKDIENDCN